MSLEKLLAKSGFALVLLAFGTIAAPLAAAPGCLMDVSAAKLVRELQDMPRPERRYSQARVIRRAVLAEQVQPGAAVPLLEMDILLAREGKHLSALLPMVQMLAKDDWDAVIDAVSAEMDPDVARAARNLLPLVVIMSGEYNRLREIYPWGKGTYSQNLNMSAATRTALEARKPELAVDIFAAHNFGNHSATRYGDIMRGLLGQGARTQAERLTGLMWVGLNAYQAEGGLTLCLERKSLAECREDATAQPNLARLEEYDSGAFTNCYLRFRDKGATATCLDELRSKADSEGYHSDPNAPATNGISGPAYVKLWGFQAMMGLAQPENIPDAIFRESGIELNILHGQILAALMYWQQDSAYEKYLQRALTPLGPQTQSILGTVASDPVSGLGRMIEWAYLDILFYEGRADALNEVAADQSATDGIQQAAKRKLALMARQSGQVDLAIEFALGTGMGSERLLAQSQSHRAAGEDAMADALLRLARDRICAPDAVFDEDVKRALIGRLLMGHAVERSDLPVTFLFH